MFVLIIAMIAIIILAGAVLITVMSAYRFWWIEQRSSERWLQRAKTITDHLNGEAEPPACLERLLAIKISRSPDESGENLSAQHHLKDDDVDLSPVQEKSS